ncbi:four helix bundle protein [Candidatus Peregrinibacteria bacterium]|nr:MAG: four helix bundle protein [Candidatus Peregrinibacteria bacterium]
MLKNQLRRSSSSVALNIAEGSGKFSVKDKKNFYLIARGSVSESVATIRLIRIDGALSGPEYDHLHSRADEIGRMLTGLIRNPS